MTRAAGSRPVDGAAAIREASGDGWSEQLDHFVEYGCYRDSAHLLLLESAYAEEPFGSLADIGCGTGRLLRFCREHDIPALGVDSSRDVVRYHAEHTGLSVVSGDVTSIPLKAESFDMVACHGLVEHLESPVQGVRGLRRITRPGGRAQISVPARWSLFPALVPLWYLSGGRYRHPWREMVGRTFSRGGFEGLLREAGWEVERLAMFKASSFLDWARIPHSPAVSRRVESSRFIRNAFGIMLVANCRRPRQ